LKVKATESTDGIVVGSFIDREMPEHTSGESKTCKRVNGPRAWPALAADDILMADGILFVSLL
jgi:hypothetical protein